MVTEFLAPKWTPAGFSQRVRRIIRRPEDVLFAIQIGIFMWRAPSLLRRRNLRALLDELRVRPRPAATDAKSSRERILRLRRLWLMLPFMRSRFNCYVRALTLYRFLEAGSDVVNIHFGIEERDDPAERLRGHAWITVEGQLFEGPPELLNARVREVPLASTEALG